MRTRSYFYCGWTTTLNIVLNALTMGRFLFLEGRVKNGIFKNWLRRVDYRPKHYEMPTTEQEIKEIIKETQSIRVFGAGHSFNEGVKSDLTLMSLDNYAGIVCEDLPNKRVTVKGGTRVRDVSRLLFERGLAFKALPSHNAQSIGGILSTDVHGTGRDWGWVSEMVVSLKLIDGKGIVHDCKPEDDLFRAAIGGIGAVGIISEVTVQARDRFNVEQTCEIADVEYVRKNLDAIISDNSHMSLYIFPFSEKCQINTWNPTENAKSFLGPLREFANISLDAFVSAWLGNLMAYTGILKTFSRIAYRWKKGTNLVLESSEAFSRTIYHLHQELEFTVPYEDTIEMCQLFLNKFEQMYLSNPKETPYSFIEVRFTPEGHDLSMIGPGRDRRSAYIDLISNDTHGFEKYYAEVEDMIREIRARPHLGKFCETLDKVHLANVYGAHFMRFLELLEQHDPEKKFANNFTRRLFRD